MFAVIAENDESQWSDETGTRYHFPKRYLKYLPEGTQVVYYKGKMKNKRYSDTRLSPAPHYFAIATIASVYADRESSKGDYFADIKDYQPFDQAVLAKHEGSYLETIPDNRKSNYWRDGVRPINQSTYDIILSFVRGLSHPPASYTPELDLNDNDQAFESYVEGEKKSKYVSTYERDPRLRQQAIDIHGVTCEACGINFGEKYGPYAEGLIHIHHIVPVSTFGKSKKVDPRTELIPLCANCHAVIHRRKNRTLSVEELKKMISAASSP
ncbi:HNH endonuclease [Marinobacterium sp. AK62]|uniref:HNH endonuclease n=1 Tax=Marinobacterium alkalitolerans TaxID=1542925 RepID=A0ABS3ZDR0_9GAMM|nr:HNH endonuclease [Marinobacterium alkalitolerans]MBP0049835.1 HNH endonuclease [Marinobacterium alkalitolerans]